MRKLNGFTLIELLVVIAIIALLLAILMPSLRAARDQAKKTVCTGHVKGLALAVRMYADDHDSKTHNSPNYGLWDNAWQNPTKIRKYGPNESMAIGASHTSPTQRTRKSSAAQVQSGLTTGRKEAAHGDCQRKSISNTALTA